MAMVAADEADLVATVRWGNEWDIAAAMLIAQEAGATFTDALGQKLSFNRENPTAFGFLCCAPDFHSAAFQRLSVRARVILGSLPVRVCRSVSGSIGISYRKSTRLNSCHL